MLEFGTAYTHVTTVVWGHCRKHEVQTIPIMRGHARQSEEVKPGKVTVENLVIFAVIACLVGPVESRLKSLLVVLGTGCRVCLPRQLVSNVEVVIQVFSVNKLGGPCMQGVLSGPRGQEKIIFSQVIGYRR